MICQSITCLRLKWLRLPGKWFDVGSVKSIKTRNGSPNLLHKKTAKKWAKITTLCASLLDLMDFECRMYCNGSVSANDYMDYALSIVIYS
jgi:hypothetical protein